MNEQAVFDTLKYRVEVDMFGTRRYYNSDNRLHRMAGPAIEYVNGHVEWWQNDQCHRIDGPAVVYANGRKDWYINDKVMTEAEFLAATQPAVEMTVADVEKLVGKRVKIIK